MKILVSLAVLCILLLSVGQSLATQRIVVAEMYTQGS